MPLFYLQTFSYLNKFKYNSNIYKQMRCYSMDINLVVSETEEMVRKLNIL